MTLPLNICSTSTETYSQFNQDFALTISILFPLLMFGFTLVFLYYRNTTTFLSKRALDLILLTFVGYFVLWSNTALYTLIGPSSYPCALYGFIEYMTIPIIDFPYVQTVVRYFNGVSKAYFDETQKESLKEAFFGYWRVYFGSRTKRDKNLSYQFSLSTTYPIFWNVVSAIPYFLTYGIRYATDPRWNQGCYGCDTTQIDAIILLILALFDLGLVIMMNSPRVKKRDVLRIIRGSYFSYMFVSSFCVLSYALFLIDPFGVQTNKVFNFRMLYLFGIVLCYYWLTFHQVVLYKKLKRHLLLTTGRRDKVEHLAEIRGDRDLAKILKKFLIDELSLEILLFLEAIEEFKPTENNVENFEKFSTIYKEFIGPRAKNEVNLSSKIRQKLVVDYSDRIFNLSNLQEAYNEVRYHFLHDGFVRFLKKLAEEEAKKASKTPTKLSSVSKKVLNTGLTVSPAE